MTYIVSGSFSAEVEANSAEEAIRFAKDMRLCSTACNFLVEPINQQTTQTPNEK
jgi:hypothetical protein